MKKLLLSAVIAMFGLTGLKAQSTGFEAGAHIGFPIGDAGDFASINFGINAAYYWEVSANFQAGLASGYDHWITKSEDETPDIPLPTKMVSTEMKDFGFIPVAAAAKYDFGGFFGGLDLGYAIYAGSGKGD